MTLHLEWRSVPTTLGVGTARDCGRGRQRATLDRLQTVSPHYRENEVSTSAQDYHGRRGKRRLCPALLQDILQFEELSESEIALMDIDEERLRVSEVMAKKVAGALGATPRSQRTRTDAPRSTEPTTAIKHDQVGGYDPAPSPISKCRRSTG